MRLALALATALLLVGCEVGDFDDVQADFHYHYGLQPDGRIEVDNPNGSVEIEGWDENSVDISGVKFAARQSLLDSVRIDIRHTPHSIVIRTTQPSFHRGGARYVIRLPRSAAIDRINGTNGSILVRNVGAASHTAYLRTVNGSIEAEHVRGGVDAETTNGKVELRDVGGASEARSTNGHIRIDLDHVADSELKAETTNGTIDLTLREKPTGPIRAQTVNGAITLKLPGDAGAHLRADTAHAPIESDFDMVEHLRGDRPGKNHLDGTIGGGGPEIELSTANGRISILRGL